MSMHDHADVHVHPSLLERGRRFIGAVTRDPNARADLDVARVVDQLKALGQQPIEDLTPEEARRQPTVADAVRAVRAEVAIEPAPREAFAHDVSYPAAEGDLPARVYRPAGVEGQLPIVLYFHGGGFVLGGVAAYDAAPRAIAARAGVVVVSAGYRLAPEHKFPAAHDDAVEAYRWVLEEAAALGGDPARVAVMGEDAGAALALHVCVAARDEGLPLPVHQALICPMAGVDLETPSYAINEHARPLNKAMVGWFFGHALPDAQTQDDPRVDLVGKADLSGLPPATLVTAEIDPLRSEGWALAEKLRDAGVAVNAIDYEGATHGFFGMGEVARDARLAQDAVARDLACAFARDERWTRIGRAL
ncbi:alpha/beta hydrolase [Methylopila turkensis]|uniref:Acetylhydrolase n=1 Tax=Methylopila turkensis TaxID=1437816 RepID=A0A9W6JQM7_9HYPH|nr:alpha/beta hydrolase [Methylopila turkensis]GLK80240.1 acetylhydrolase [Methylopila turkensis]